MTHTAKDLTNKIAFVAGVGDDQGYGWAIAKELAERGATLVFGTWVPVHKIFTHSWEEGKFDESRKLSDGSLMEVAAVYPMDAAYDVLEDVPEDVRQNKRYVGVEGYTLSEVAARLQKEFGGCDILVHSLANGPEVKKPLLETSRKGYLAAVSASSYSFVGLVQWFGPILKAGGSVVSLTYFASEKAVPGYGGGMSSAKAALESDVRTLAWEAGRKWQVRINAISAGPLRSRAARAIGFIDRMIDYTIANAPLARELQAEEVARAAAFLLSPQAAAITGCTLYVDNGMHAMGVAVDSAAFNQGAE